jgi:phage terminase Nu1 subunit (DNA packaging protein)
MALSLRQEIAAALQGVTSRRLRQMDHEPTPPPRAEDGTYPVKAFGEWMRTRAVESFGVSNDGRVYDYSAERARLTKAQADKTELEVAELRGELISTPKALIQVEAMVAAMRAKLLSLPTKVAAKIATTPEAMGEAQEAIRAEIYEALEEIASDRFQEEIQGRIAVLEQSTVMGISKPSERSAQK